MSGLEEIIERNKQDASMLAGVLAVLIGGGALLAMRKPSTSTRKTGLSLALDHALNAKKAKLQPRLDFMRNASARNEKDRSYFFALQAVYQATEKRLDDNISMLAKGEQICKDGRKLRDLHPPVSKELAYLWKDFGGALRRSESLAIDLAGEGFSPTTRRRWTPATARACEHVEKLDNELLLGPLYARHVAVGFDDLPAHYAFPEYVEEDRAAFSQKLQDALAEAGEEFDEARMDEISREAENALDFDQEIYEEWQEKYGKPN